MMTQMKGDCYQNIASKYGRQIANNLGVKYKSPGHEILPRKVVLVSAVNATLVFQMASKKRNTELLKKKKKGQILSEVYMVFNG